MLKLCILNFKKIENNIAISQSIFQAYALFALLYRCMISKGKSKLVDNEKPIPSASDRQTFCTWCFCESLLGRNFN